MYLRRQQPMSRSSFWIGRVPDRGSRRSLRLGLTLIEVLVVLGILGLLAGLLLGALQRVRSASLRANCAARLRQVGLALHQYHQSYHVFPPGMTSLPESEAYRFMSWHTRLLPFVEQGTLWERAVEAYQTDPLFTGSAHTGRYTVVPLYGCPADPKVLNPADYQGILVAFTSYLGVEGTDFLHKDGILFQDSAIRFTDVKDGASNTLFVGERPPPAGGAFGWWYAGVGQNGTGSADMVLGVRELNYAALFPLCAGGPYHFTFGDSSNPCDSFHFWSNHPIGAHFLFVDGAVRFLPYASDSFLPALATRSGGEASVEFQ